MNEESGRQIRVVLDSCRWDNFDKKFQYRCSHSNVTYPSACAYLGLGFHNGQLDNLALRRKNGWKERLYSDNSFLSETMWPWKSLSSRFESWYCTKEGGDHTDMILEQALEDISEDDRSYSVIWLMPTHTPYYLNEKPYQWFLDNMDNLVQYNKDQDSITKDEMHKLRQRQKECAWDVARKVNKFFHELGDCDYVLTADHGESFGENHRFGHGTDIHLAQFLIPHIEGNIRDGRDYNIVNGQYLDEDEEEQTWTDDQNSDQS